MIINGMYNDEKKLNESINVKNGSYIVMKVGMAYMEKSSGYGYYIRVISDNCNMQLRIKTKTGDGIDTRSAEKFLTDLYLNGSRMLDGEGFAFFSIND